MNLTFAEQVKLILGRRGMTIKRLAELVEEHTGKPMSRQNMTQRLGRDNFQEQDMRMIAEILGCKLELIIVEPEVPEARDITVGELADMLGEPEMVAEESEVATATVEDAVSEAVESTEEPVASAVSEEKSLLRKGIGVLFQKGKKQQAEEEQASVGDINPYTGKEYKSNSVRMHPKRIGYVQVYDQEQHQWTDMTEWAFLGYQERKKALLGKDYEPPIYLD